MKMLRKTAVLLVLALSACGEVADVSDSTSQALDTFWTGSNLVNYSIGATPGCMGARQIEFIKSRHLISGTYYDYATSDIFGFNGPGGTFGPFIAGTETVTAQTLYCSLTSGGSQAVQMLPASGGQLPGYIFSVPQLSCRLITYWPHSPATTMFLTVAPAALLAHASPTRTSYTLTGAATPSLGWCGTMTINITGQ